MVRFLNRHVRCQCSHLHVFSNMLYYSFKDISFLLFLFYFLPCEDLCTSQCCFTLLCSTTTLRWSPFSHVSMALHMLQILSNAGAWWSGQPNSRTWWELFISKRGFSSHISVIVFLFWFHCPERRVYLIDLSGFQKCKWLFIPYGLTLISHSSTRSG